ncbi:Conserved oligomeric Golgi complex subunit [Recurvomyces mirabilis]|uniref:Conserved oligomeric Golgi complex subunit n=1 Tax=Recurvomyces mirabilis TaxID=574656 RepID=A0AAE0WSL7_9PEZI|nr:Conserved oligomeric Golgi complex subunit [Recurvomyces mirabilis]KAK5159465.1 Conserved oligomeric Golgi complex subunit [Recurvomyces mirabilis]
MAAGGQQSYVDYDAFTAPTFSPTAYANQLVLQTNNPTDTPLDLSTPLSRVLFDVQEVDTHIDTLTTQNALPIITHTSERAEASQRILDEVESQVNGLQESYRRLEREVQERYEAAEQVRLAAERMVRTLRLGRSVQRAVQMGRQVEGLMEGMQKGGCGNMVPAANALLGLRQLFNTTGKGEEGDGLGRVQVVSTLRNEIVAPAERGLLARAQQVEASKLELEPDHLMHRRKT